MLFVAISRCLFCYGLLFYWSLLDSIRCYSLLFVAVTVVVLLFLMLFVLLIVAISFVVGCSSSLLPSHRGSSLLLRHGWAQQRWGIRGVAGCETAALPRDPRDRFLSSDPCL